MPVTKTAKRALRSSKRKAVVNKKITTELEIAMRRAKKSGLAKDVKRAISLTDKTAKKKIIHKNKAARIKSSLSKLLPKRKTARGKSKTTNRSSKK